MSRLHVSRRVRNTVIGLLGAAGIALIAIPASGANWSASAAGQVHVTTGTLSLNLSDPAGHSGTFQANFANLAPGDQQTQVFYVKNTGSIPADVKIGQPITPTDIKVPVASINKLEFGVDGVLPLTPVTSLPSSINLGRLGAGQTMTVTLRVGLDSSAGNEWQGASVGANVTVTLEQVS